MSSILRIFVLGLATALAAVSLAVAPAFAKGGGTTPTPRSLAGYLRLDSVILAPGWTYVDQKNGEGTSSRVELQFTEIATGKKVDFLVELGKTRVG